MSGFSGLYMIGLIEELYVCNYIITFCHEITPRTYIIFTEKC